jgi:two-component system, NarL family, invasion response regulator UvrY
VITILIVDDHDIVREGLRQIVSETADIVVGSEARTGAEAVEQVRNGRWDAVVLDLNLPDRSGLDVLADIRAIAPTLPVLILSMHQELSYAARALKSGALGYVSKNSAREHLVNAIRRVARGERFLTPDLAEGLAFDLIRPGREATHHGLSGREFQVLCMIAAGKPPRAIALESNVSVKTIGTHRARLLLKMGLKNNAEIVQYAIANDLLHRRS